MKKLTLSILTTINVFVLILTTIIGFMSDAFSLLVIFKDQLVILDILLAVSSVFICIFVLGLFIGAHVENHLITSGHFKTKYSPPIPFFKHIHLSPHTIISLSITFIMIYFVLLIAIDVNPYQITKSNMTSTLSTAAE